MFHWIERRANEQKSNHGIIQRRAGYTVSFISLARRGQQLGQAHVQLVALIVAWLSRKEFWHSLHAILIPNA
jgi:hypothetical protein